MKTEDPHELRKGLCPLMAGLDFGFFARSPSFKLQSEFATDIDSEIEFWHQSGFAGCSRITHS